MRNKIYPIFSGGLGNQLFTLFAAYQLAGYEFRNVVIAKNCYLQHRYRVMEPCFERLGTNAEIPRRIIFLLYVFRIINRFHRAVKRSNISWSHGEISFDYTNKPYFYTDKLRYIHGYFQTASNFIGNERQYNQFIDYLCAISNAEKDSTINRSRSLAISVRLGNDYKLNRYINICNAEYYRKCILAALAGRSIDKLIVFSDEPQEAIRLIGSMSFDLPIEICKATSAFDSFCKLIGYQNLIICNSSFAWLAAFYRHESKIIYAPSMWAKLNSSNKLKVPSWNYIDV